MHTPKRSSQMAMGLEGGGLKPRTPVRRSTLGALPLASSNSQDSHNGLADVTAGDQHPKLHPPAPHGTTSRAYNMRCVALALRIGGASAVTIATSTYLTRLLLARMSGRRHRFLLPGAWLMAEVVFYFWYQRRYAELNMRPDMHEPDKHDPLKNFERLANLAQTHKDVFNSAAFLSLWFNGADVSNIRRGNVAELLSYGVWYRSPATMEEQGLSHVLLDQVKQLEEAFGVEFPQGYLPGLKPMTHLWEDIRTIYRPLLFYAGTEVLAILSRIVMLSLGFKSGTINGIRWYSRDSSARGLGLGRTFGGPPPLQAPEPQLQPQPQPPMMTPWTQAVVGCTLGRLATWLSLARPRSGVPPAAPSAASNAAPGAASLNARGTAPEAPTSNCGVGLQDRASQAASSGGSPCVPSLAPLVEAHALELLDEASPGSPGLPLAQRHKQAAGRPDGRLASHSGTRQTAPAEQTPIVLLHGVGAGVFPYLDLIRRLAATGAPVLALEYKHVSQRLCTTLHSADDIADTVVAMLDEHGISRACILAHSYGTFVASRVAQLHATRVQSMALIDPVCFGMFMPHLLSSLYDVPFKRSGWLLWVMHYVIKFTLRDLHCAAIFCRRFYWSDLNLWPDDLPERTLVVLHAKDPLIHVPAVAAMMSSYAHKILTHPKHGHGGFVFDIPWQERLVEEVAAMAAAGSFVAKRLDDQSASQLASLLTSMGIGADDESEGSDTASTAIRRQAIRSPSLDMGRWRESPVHLHRAQSDGNMSNEQEEAALLEMAELGRLNHAVLVRSRSTRTATQLSLLHFGRLAGSTTSPVCIVSSPDAGPAGRPAGFGTHHLSVSSLGGGPPGSVRRIQSAVDVGSGTSSLSA